MGLFDFFRGQFIDVIEWLDDSNDTLVYRFERHNNAIKQGAKLTVRPGQMAVFVNQGQIADIFSEGMYELITANLPILSDLQNWDHGFRSPFQAEVYYFNTKRFGDLKWGTRNPIMLRDAEFGPVRMRAFGSYEMSIADPRRLLEQVVGTDGHFTLDEVTDRLRNVIISKFSSALAQAQIPALELAANYQQLGSLVGQQLALEFQDFGFALEDFWVENISFPPDVEEALDRRSASSVIGDLSRYFQYQQAEAMVAAAQSDNAMGATMGAGIGAGIGAAAAQQSMEMQRRAQQQVQQPVQQQAPQAIPQQARPPQAAPPPRPAPPVQAAPPPPPPLPELPPYHLGIDGEIKGPFEMAQIDDLMRRGSIDHETLGWTAGMGDWQAIGELEDFRPLFDNQPPPMPAG